MCVPEYAWLVLHIMFTIYTQFIANTRRRTQINNFGRIFIMIFYVYFWIERVTSCRPIRYSPYKWAHTLTHYLISTVSSLMSQVTWLVRQRQWQQHHQQRYICLFSGLKNDDKIQSVMINIVSFMPIACLLFDIYHSWNVPRQNMGARNQKRPNEYEHWNKTNVKTKRNII